MFTKTKMKPFHSLSKSQQNKIIAQAMREEEPLPDVFWVENDPEIDGYSDTDSIFVPETQNFPPDINNTQPEHSILFGNVFDDNHFSCQESDDSDEFPVFSDSEEESAEEQLTPDEQFVEDISEFCLTFLPDYGTNILLKILERTNKFTNLPKNHSKLLGNLAEMPKPVKIKGGYILHIGIRTNLKILPKLQMPATLLFNFSYDGVQLFKSSANSFWPLVMSFPNLPEVGVKLVSIFVGNKAELDANEFFSCLVDEVNEIIEKDGGIVEVGPQKEKLTFRFHLCVSDTPAKAFALGLIGHTGYWACPNCHQKGKYIGKRMTYDTVAGQLRTDEEFRRFDDKYHHSKRTPLVDLACKPDMVMDFPSDAMHGMDAGTQRQMLDRLLHNRFIDLEEAELLIKKVKPYMPTEFARKIRSLKEFKKFKAVEFRFYALYFGPLFFTKCVNNQKVIDHYMLFTVAYRLLMGDGFEVSDANIDQAQEFLDKFVADFPEVYGEQYVGFNVHMLLHIPLYVRRFGPLNNFSCYQYENYYQMFGKWVRKPSNFFVQILRRWIQTAGTVKLKANSDAKFNSIHLKGNKKDSHILLKDGKVFVINSDYVTLEGKCFVGKKYINYESFFSYPVRSEILNIYKVSQLSDEEQHISLSDIQQKMVAMPFDEHSLIVIPLIHCNTQ